MNTPLLESALLAGSPLMSWCGGAVLGYVGPAGIGALGVLLAVAAVLLIGIIGLVLYPVRLFLRRRRSSRQVSGEAAPDAASAGGSKTPSREAQEKA